MISLAFSSTYMEGCMRCCRSVIFKYMTVGVPVHVIRACRGSTGILPFILKGPIHRKLNCAV